MKARRSTLLAFVSVALAAAANPGWAQAPPASPAQPQDGQATALTRGPLHEAFAEVITFQPQAGLTVPKKPPAAIEEVPPEQKPEGDGYLWISGYWAWDEDRDDFIWVSGVWRIPPPGTEWVPGYWTEAEDSHQWVSGYWRPMEDGQAGAVEYLPQPPDSLEQGPSSPQPSENEFWVPGCWEWRDGRYAWRAGYWAPIQGDWTWVPARYAWTPGGCVFVAGHWDYSFWERGLCYAPVYFEGAVYARPHFRFVPGVVLDTFALFNHLFCRPAYSHYYFGDYYDGHYRRLGIQPWFAFHGSRFGYDPIYVHSRWYYTRQYPDWAGRIRGWYDYRAAHVDARPPHTLAATVALGARGDGDGGRAMRLAATVADAARDSAFPVRLGRVEAQRREHLTDLKSRFDNFARERRSLEQSIARESKEGKPEPRRVQLPDTGVREAMRQFTRERMTEPARLAAKPPTPAPGPAAKPQGPLPGPSAKPQTPAPGPAAKPRGSGDRPRVERPEAPDRPERPLPPKREKPKAAPAPRVVPELPDMPRGKAAESPGADNPRPDNPRPEKPRPERGKGKGR